MAVTSVKIHAHKRCALKKKNHLKLDKNMAKGTQKQRGKI
jgi:hypothetical protein